jgi:pyruvate formate lyase activating enzyme
MMDKNPTSSETLRRAYDIGKRKLNYVYTGNIYDPEGESTYCPKCRNLLIERQNYHTSIRGLDLVKGKEARCNKCGKEINGVFE